MTAFQEVVIVLLIALSLLFRESLTAVLQSLHFEEQLSQLLGPVLLVMFTQETQFTQMMGIAQGVTAILELLVGDKSIMHRPTLKVGQNSHLVHRHLTAFRVKTIQG